MSTVGKQTVGLLVAVAVILAIGGLVAFRLGARPHAASPSPALPPPTAGSALANSMSNAKQLALGNLIYATDYDDRFPPDMGNYAQWQAATMPYLKNTRLFYSANPRGAHFLGNEDLSAAPSSEIVRPTEAVMLYEDKEWPDGRRIIGYADGHVKPVTGFDMATGLVVDLSPKGRAIVDAAKASSLAPKRPTSKKNPLGMPGE
jgi:prepilin-type processing-associated H-X9-DG protein